jgi:hypothetical protein
MTSLFWTVLASTSDTSCLSNGDLDQTSSSSLESDSTTSTPDFDPFDPLEVLSLDADVALSTVKAAQLPLIPLSSKKNLSLSLSFPAKDFFDFLHAVKFSPVHFTGVAFLSVLLFGMFPPSGAFPALFGLYLFSSDAHFYVFDRGRLLDSLEPRDAERVRAYLASIEL